jgi:hypothetical protein
MAERLHRSPRAVDTWGLRPIRATISIQLTGVITLMSERMASNAIEADFTCSGAELAPRSSRRSDPNA